MTFQQGHTTMQTITFSTSGDPISVLHLTTQNTPTPTPDEVLIKVKLATIQPADFLFINGKYRVKPIFPQIAGIEGYGEIVAIGSEVRTRTVGDLVAFRSTGVWAEYAVAHVSRTYIAPKNIAQEIAAQFALNPLTAWGLLDFSIKHPDSKILYTAANSVVAKQSAYIADKRGHKPFGLIRDKDCYQLLDLKTKQAISSADTVAECLRYADVNFDVIIDAVGGKETPTLIQHVKPLGTFVSYGILDSSSFTLQTSTILFKNLTWLGFGIDAWLNQLPSEKLAEVEINLWSYLNKKPELAPVSQVFNMRDFQAAIKNAATNKIGKTIISLA
jgi:NADPH2:quinone reductase